MLRATAAEFELQQPGRNSETESTEGLQHHTSASQGGRHITLTIFKLCNQIQKCLEERSLDLEKFIKLLDFYLHLSFLSHPVWL